MKWTVLSEDSGVRLLSFVRKHAPAIFSTKDLRFAIEHHKCSLNKKVERFCSKKLQKGDVVEITLEHKPVFTFDPTRLLYEDDSFLVYDKPPQISSPDLASLLKLLLVHRLDRDTTGVLLLAKQKSMQKGLEELFRARTIEKSYVAIVTGRLPTPKGVIEKPIGKLSEREGEGLWGIVPPPRGAAAKTFWEVESTSSHFSYVRCKPVTGRTHQIRVHLSHLGCPIVGDLRYGKREAPLSFRPLLHASTLAFEHPLTKEKMFFEAPLPEDFQHFAVEKFLKRS